ncbi:hypothetical protein M9H77_21697 [Catharanthus roseus]|uniref:Uncharacterized protein n=1 Tax=Catharanthus roseus TaxID=4058 RepID=A0ACC0AP67_CATRO|nr:hypothetical protein M9H77_21697 [Catharanthus roseus]
MCQQLTLALVSDPLELARQATASAAMPAAHSWSRIADFMVLKNRGGGEGERAVASSEGEGYDEQRLRDEVIYLHSLWHQGPPTAISANSSNHHLYQLSNRTQFKRGRGNPRAQRGNGRIRNGNNRNQADKILTETIQDSGKEWPCNPSSDTPSPISGWPMVNFQHNPQPILPSPEECARFAASQVQLKAVKATIEFFRSKNSDDHDEIGDVDDNAELGEDNEGDEDENRDDLVEKEYEGEEYRFFVKLFKADSGLREYYEKNNQNGNFSCLVCCGTGKKKAKRKFKDCVALIQHSVSIARTEKKRAHRAYGKAVCKVLGWDIDKLPTIVSAMTKNLGVSLTNSGGVEGEAPTSVWPSVTPTANSQTIWPSVESGKEWPSNPSFYSLAPASGWHTVTAQNNSQPLLPSPKEGSRFAADQAQFKAVKAAINFFRTNNSDDDDDYDDELGEDNEGDEDEHHDALVEEDGGEENRFFVKVFEEDSVLREYYEKNYQNGDFSCLVCCGVGVKKARRRFKDCVALVQHSVSIARTKKKRAHRAYGKAICKVLGWDIDKLPAIVSALSQNLGASLSNSGASEHETLDVGDEIKDNLNILRNTEELPDIDNGEELQKKESTSSETLPSNDETIVSEQKLLTAQCDKDPDLAASNIVKDN